MRPAMAAWALGSGLGLGLLAAQGMPLWVLGAAHVLGALALGMFDRRETAWRSVVLALVFPGLGAMAAWWLAIEADRPASGPIELPPAPLPEWPDEGPVGEAAHCVWSLAWQLAEGEMESKLGAAAAMAALEGPEVVRALRGLLTHEDPHTRLVASLELQKREEALSRALLEARRTGEALVRVRAARCYAESGLPTGAAAGALWLEAAEAARGVLEQPGAWAELARALQGLGRWHEALDAAEEALKREPESALAAQVQCEALVAVGAIAQLPQAARRWAALMPEHPGARRWGREAA